MNDDLKFSCKFPSFPEGQPVTAKEVEEILLERIKVSNDSDLGSLYQLSTLYAQSGRLEEAEACILQLLEINKHPKGAALHFFQLGQLGEKRDDFERAERFYRRALEVGPDDTEINYFIHNNLGFSLNELGRFAEAEPFLREAIRTNPHLPNAHKNLGLCLWRLGRHTEAAESFIMATRVEAADGRSLKHLEQLFAEHPEIAKVIPDFDSLLAACRAAVAEAEKHRPDLEAWWVKGRETDAAR